MKHFLFKTPYPMILLLALMVGSVVVSPLLAFADDAVVSRFIESDADTDSLQDGEESELIATLTSATDLVWKARFDSANEQVLQKTVCFCVHEHAARAPPRV